MPGRRWTKYKVNWHGTMQMMGGRVSAREIAEEGAQVEDVQPTDNLRRAFAPSQGNGKLIVIRENHHTREIITIQRSPCQGTWL